MIACIYTIRSKACPDKMYIGSSLNYVKRKWQHLDSLKKNKHPNPKIQAHVKKYGLDDLAFDILLRVDQPQQILSIEQVYLDTLSPSFNICKITGSPAGLTRSNETRQKLKESAAVRYTPEVRQRMSVSQTGKKATLETRLKMSEARKGKTFKSGWKLPDDVKCKMRGRIVSEQTRQRISAANKGRVVTDETRRKISEANKGRLSPLKGLKRPEDFGQKISRTKQLNKNKYG